jgi:hypothetical protein
LVMADCILVPLPAARMTMLNDMMIFPLTMFRVVFYQFQAKKRLS